MAERDWGPICVLLSEVRDNRVYQWKRLKIGLYALSEHSLDNQPSEKIVGYVFSDLCYEGMNDRELLRDMVSLQFLGLIKRYREKVGDMLTSHYWIELTSKGMLLAERTKQELDPQKMEAIKKVARDLSDLHITSRDLLKKYASNWMEKYTSKILV